MTSAEKILARRCAEVMRRSSDGLAPLASTLESMAEMLTTLADGGKVSDDVKRRLEDMAPLVRGVDYEALQLAMAGTETLLTALVDRGEI